jgi:lipopolysaccharide export system permease protein
MRVLDRYIVSAVGGAVALVMAVLLTLLALFLFISEQSDVGTGNYGSLQALRFVALNLPAHLFQFLPIGALLGALLGLGAMARNSEFTVMRAAGVSVARIGLSVVMAGVLVAMVAIGVGEFLAPPLTQMGRAHKAVDRYANISFAGRGGAWVRDGNRLLRAEGRAEAGAFGGITVFELTNDHRLGSVVQADSARLAEGGGWLLENAAGTEFAALAAHTRRDQARVLDTVVTGEFLGMAASDPDELSLRELHAAVGYLQRNQQDDRAYRFAFWSNIARIVAIPLAVLLALPFMFGSLRSSGGGAKATLGLVMGMGYFILQRLVASGTIAFALDPLLLAWLPTVALAIAVSVLTLRLKT